jgi:phosphinothricin acetyltransferase
LHEKLGFQKVAHFREVGFKFNQWIDVGYWQTALQGYRERGEQSDSHGL